MVFSIKFRIHQHEKPAVSFRQDRKTKHNYTID